MYGVNRFRIIRIVVAILVTTILVSCKKGKLSSIEDADFENLPVQSVVNMEASQTNEGHLQFRMKTALMERFNTEKGGYELFTGGFIVYVYNEEGLLETEITSKEAKHTQEENNEKWEAYGNVVIKNYLKAERIETDTVYWDREKQMIYTDCYVKMSSPDGFVQGYGLESDERARNAVLLRPFDSYSVISKDTTITAFVDSANFIGPLL